MTTTPPDPEGRNITEAAAARRRAAVAGHVGDDATARDLLHHDDADVRAAALQALHRMGAAAVAEIADALTDPAPIVRRRALAVAIGTDLDLRPLLADADSSVVEQAAWALGEREDVDAVDALVAVTDHADALVREAAIAALGALQHERGLPAILAAIDDKPAVRRRAVLALAPFDGPEVEAALERARADRDWQVRDAADVIDDARRADD